MNELTWMNWNERTETNELKWMICRPHLQKVVRTRQFFTILCEIELSLQSRAHFVDLILKKWSDPISFWQFLCEKELSLQSRAHFVDNFPDRGAKLRKQRPFSGDHRWPLYPKNTRFLRPRMFSAGNSRVPDRSHMMMWLTWWTTASFDNRS